MQKDAEAWIRIALAIEGLAAWLKPNGGGGLASALTTIRSTLFSDNEWTSAGPQGGPLAGGTGRAAALGAERPGTRGRTGAEHRGTSDSTVTDYRGKLMGKDGQGGRNDRGMDGAEATDRGGLRDAQRDPQPDGERRLQLPALVELSQGLVGSRTRRRPDRGPSQGLAPRRRHWKMQPAGPMGACGPQAGRVRTDTSLDEARKALLQNEGLPLLVVSSTRPKNGDPRQVLGILTAHDLLLSV